MSNYRFTDGNLIILYLVQKLGQSTDQNKIPVYLEERVRLCLDIYKTIVHSKPDGNKTAILIVGVQPDSDNVSKMLTKAGVDEGIIAKDHLSKNVAECFDRVLASIENKMNPPYLYFVGSVWQRDIYDSVVLSRMKGYRTQFEGALDQRPVSIVKEEKALDAPRKGLEAIKRKATDKAIDLVLNRMFPEDKK